MLARKVRGKIQRVPQDLQHVSEEKQPRRAWRRAFGVRHTELEVVGRESLIDGRSIHSKWPPTILHRNPKRQRGCLVDASRRNAAESRRRFSCRGRWNR